jgi:hypothetical protein
MKKTYNYCPECRDLVEVNEFGSCERCGCVRILYIKSNGRNEDEIELLIEEIKK